MHTPELQVTPDAFGSVVVHALLHVPQSLTSVCSLTHVVPQSVDGAVQVAAQWPVPSHVCPPGQALPHVPQLLLSLCSLTQLPLQSE